MTGGFDAGGLLKASGYKSDDLLTALGLDDPNKLAVGSASQINLSALDRAEAKKQAGLPLTQEEANAYAVAQGSRKTNTQIGVALQPLMILSDITKGLIGEARGKEGSAERGTKAAAGHLTYGLAEYLPGLKNARTREVTGAELLKGTRYEGNIMAALAVEVFADPSVVLTGAGVVAKSAATAGRLANLEKFAKTADGAATIRDALKVANQRGEALLKLGDEITGVPAVVRGVGNSKPAQAVRKGLQEWADTQLPGNNVVSNALRREGGGTLGDALLTPDQKRSIYSPEQLARDEFRNAVKFGAEDTSLALKGAAQVDADTVTRLTKGLPKADAAEANRLLGVFTTTTKPEVAQEALRKLTTLSQKVGRDLEPTFVDAVKALDRTRQNTLGAAMKAENIPVIVDPKVNQAIQKAQTGEDLVALTGKYRDSNGRPVAILMTDYRGRDNLPKTINKIAEGPEIPASTTIDRPKLTATFEQALPEVPVPPKPVEPVGTPAPRAELPRTPASTAKRLADEPVNVTPPEARKVPPAPDAAPVTPRTPREVMDALFGPTPARELGTTARAALPNEVPPAALVPPASTGKAEAATPPVRDTVEAPDVPKPRTPGDVLSQTLRLPDAPVPRALEVDVPAASTTGTTPEAVRLYDDLHARYVAGETTEAGQASTILMAAANLKAAGKELTREDFPQFAQDFTQAFRVAQQGPDIAQEMATFFRGYEPPSMRTEAPTLPVPENVRSDISAPAAPRLTVTAKTPGEIIQEVLSPGARDPYVALPAGILTPTPKDVRLPVAMHTPAEGQTISIIDPSGARAPTPIQALNPGEQLVSKNVPTTYRTVQVDSNALDWAALPDDSSRRAVLNSIEDARNAKFELDASGNLQLDRPNITVPLDHPTISRYFSNDEVLAAQRQGTTIGERTIVRREQVPNWFNPREAAPLDVQRALREQALKEASDSAFSNDLPALIDRQLADPFSSAPWVIGDAYVSYDRLVKPNLLDTRLAANNYAARVEALRGRPPTRGEVFQYRLALARYRRASNLRNLNPAEVVKHLDGFYQANPGATLYEGVLSTAKQFDLGSQAVPYLTKVMRQAESGFERQMSKLERLEFAQYLHAKEVGRPSRTGGLLIEQLKRKPETVSQEFQQVFEQDVNALKLLDEQVRTRTAAVVRAQTFRQYRAYLEETGQLISQKQLAELRNIPEHRLTPAQREMRMNAAKANTLPGARAAWKVVDRNVEGFFHKGDLVPWWAYFDLFGAGSVDDAAVSAATLNRGGLDVYNRLWSTQNAMMLSSPSSLVTDQVGQFLQMGLWGITPDAVIEGMIRRATATPEQIKTMQASGIQSAKLESNLGASRDALTQLAQRLDGDTDMSRMERVIDGIIRFRERGTGINPQAVTGVMGVAADVTHLGSRYLFQARSRLSDLQRESLYFHRLQLGDTPKEAARFANDVLMDMRLVPAYAKVVRKFWPFFNWIAMSGPRSVVTVLRKPGLNAAFQRIPKGTDDRDNPQDNTRRILARDGGYINLGIDERNGARLYLDPRNWDPNSTIPQLMDWSGTKVGAVGLPWMAQLVVTVQWGQDRFGRNIYSDVLEGGTGGFQEAYRVDPSKTLKIAAQAVMQQFQPSYAPGSSRAQAFVRSVLATAQLPEDGSKDIAVAKMLTTTPQGRAYLSLMQNGNFALIDRDLKGVRESKYTDAAPSMARAALNYVVPIRAVNASQYEQGTALQKISVEQLKFQEWLSGERKKLAELEAGGASAERIQQEEERIDREAEKKGADLDYLDLITR